MDNAKETKENQIHEKLIDAAQKLDLGQVRQLLESGASPKYVRHTNINGWYSGDTMTALYSAVYSNFSDQILYNDVIQELLNKGADPNFSAVRGNWNHCQAYPTFNGVIGAITKFKDPQQRNRLFQMFLKSGANINKMESHGREKGWRAHQSRTFYIIKIMNICGFISQLSELQKQMYDKMDADKLKEEYEKKMWEKFKQEKKIVQPKPQQGDQEPEIQKQQTQQAEKNKGAAEAEPDISLIQTFLNYGANVNSFRSYDYWENYSQNNDEQDEQVNVNQYQSLLHIAIMNNSSNLVKLLLEKGANVDQKCRFSIKRAVFPKDWNKKMKSLKIQKNKRKLKQAFESKKELDKQWKQYLKQKKSQKRKTKQEEEEAKQIESEYKQRFQDIEFQVYKATKYDVEKDAPYSQYVTYEYSCSQICKKLNVKPEILQMISQAEEKIQKQKQQLKKQQEAKIQQEKKIKMEQQNKDQTKPSNENLQHLLKPVPPAPKKKQVAGKTVENLKKKK